MLSNVIIGLFDCLPRRTTDEIVASIFKDLMRSTDNFPSFLFESSVLKIIIVRDLVFLSRISLTKSIPKVSLIAFDY